MKSEQNIVMILNSDVNHSNLTSKYVRFTANNIISYTQRYVSKNTRQAQNSFLMYHFISNSLNEAVQLNIVVESHNYTLWGTPVGELIFKLLIKTSIIDTRSTSSHLIENLNRF